MNRGAKWGLVAALTVALMTPLMWHDRQPFFQNEQNAAPRPEGARAQGMRTNAESAMIQRLQAKKHQGNEQVVAKDIARTAALCVRDCRTMLTEISNELSHASSRDEQLRIIQQHMKEHAQFVSLSVADGNNTQVQVGQQLRPDLQKQAHAHARQKDDFYVSDLYHLPQKNDPKEKIGMTLAVPIVNGNQVKGSLSADVEMGHLMQVINTQDRQMGTTTKLLGMNGVNEENGTSPSQAKGSVKTKQLTRKAATAKVDGTAWRVQVASIQDRGTKDNYMPTEVLAMFSNDLSDAMVQQMSKDINGQLVRKNSRHTYIFRSKTLPLDQVVTYFKNKGAVISEPLTRVRPNEIRTSDRVVEQPNDVFYSSNQWNLPLIKADKAWQINTGDPKIKIAVIDTGVDLNHPDLEGKLTEGMNMLDPSEPPQDDNGHGTHCAGIIAARTNNLEGIAGVDWGSKIMPIKAMDAEGSGTAVDIADGIYWATDHGANVISLSLGEYSDSDYLHQAIRYAYDKGVAIFAAMGNDGISDPSYPAAYPEAIAVAANDENSETASFSNYGPHTSVTAPGVAIPSTYPDRRYVALSGTSMATPHVAGVAGLIKSINPSLNPDAMRKILQDTADDLGPKGHDDYYGYGQINVAKALQAAMTSAGK